MSAPEGGSGSVASTLMSANVALPMEKACKAGTSPILMMVGRRKLQAEMRSEVLHVHLSAV